MTPEFKERWVTALRSGEYPQGIGALGRPYPEGTRYCCVGVLCELLIQDGQMVREDAMPSAGFCVFGYHLTTLYALNVYTAMTDEMRALVGLTEAQQGLLVRMNDVDALSFAEIADWIETNL